VADPSERDSDTSVVRDLGKAVRDDDRLLSALLPVSDGLLVAARK
jgi:predicted O-methyltransferase YrrM